MTTDMELVVGAGGDVRCVYGEELDLREIGTLKITRASHVEPDRDGFWWADMGPSSGPVLGPFTSRSEALEAERVVISVSLMLSQSSQRVSQCHPFFGESERCAPPVAYQSS
jgi:hypothetical protein